MIRGPVGEGRGGEIKEWSGDLKLWIWTIDIRFPLIYEQDIENENEE